MAKPGRKKEKYEKYKKSGHKELNKAKRAERNERRIAKFAHRREIGKTYTYKPNPYPKDSQEYIIEALERQRKNVCHKTETQKMTSIMRKLDNAIAQELKAIKAGGNVNGNARAGQKHEGGKRRSPHTT